MFFTSSRSLVNISYIFSILFLRAWIIFTIIILTLFWKISWLYFISFFLGGEVLSGFFIWNIIICLFVLFNCLWLWLLFWSLQDCSSFFYLQALVLNHTSPSKEDLLFFSSLLRCSWNTVLCKFKAYSIILIRILWNNYHNKFSYYPSSQFSSFYLLSCVLFLWLHPSSHIDTIKSKKNFFLCLELLEFTLWAAFKYALQQC